MSATAPSQSAPPASVAPAPPPNDDGLAALLVADGHLSTAQVQHAERVRGKLRYPRPLTCVLRDLYPIDEQQIFDAIRRHGSSLPVGALLVELGYLKEPELHAALAQQKHGIESGKLGDILLRKQLVRERDLLKVLAAKLGLFDCTVDVADVPPDLLERVPTALCTRWSMFPLRHDGERVVVAFANPQDRDAVRAVEAVLEREVVPALASRSDITEAIATLDRLRRNAHQQRERSEQVSRGSATDLVDQLIMTGIEQGASDIHIEPLRERVRVRLRCDGVLREITEFSRDEYASVTSRLKILAEANITEKRRHQDGRLLYEHPRTAEHYDLRASFYITVNGESIVLRLLNRKQTVADLRELRIGPTVRTRLIDDVLDTPSGVIVVTGPTGSGKTTTLYSCVNYLNNDTTSIITAEDPVEYQVDGIAQCSINRKLDLTFEETLRHIVRQDPDVIVLGEIRDQFSAETAIQAALTGHKVLTTLHTEDCIGALMRLRNMDIEAFLVASAVSGVLAQRLLRQVCEQCAEPAALEPRELKLLGWSHEHANGGRFRRGRGCTECHFTGYRGRVPVFELLVPTEAVKDAVMADNSASQIRRLCLGTAGMVTLLEDGLIKAADGLTTVAEVVRHLPRLVRPRPLAELRRLTGSH